MDLNIICVSDPVELQRYLSRPDDHAALIRFAMHVESRDPSNVWARMTLADHACEPEERLHLLLAAVEAGRRRWDLVEQHGEVAWWDDDETRPLLEALHACARQYAEMGYSEDAVTCIKELLAMDPEDHVGAEALAADVGLIPAVAADEGAAFRM